MGQFNGFCHRGTGIETPDLASLLVLQMETLSAMAERLTSHEGSERMEGAVR